MKLLHVFIFLLNLYYSKHRGIEMQQNNKKTEASRQAVGDSKRKESLYSKTKSTQ